MKKILAIAHVVLLEMLRRKDLYVLLVVIGAMTLFMLAVNVFNEARIVRYIKDVSLLLIWICSLVIAVTSSARQLPAERENRTLFPLLAKPVSRSQVLLGKFLGCWAASGLALFSFYLVFILLTLIREPTPPWLNYFQALALHWIALGIICSITLLGSVLFTAMAANVTISFFIIVGILLFGRYLNDFALQLAEPSQSLLMLLYYVIPHLELFDIRDLIIHSWPLIPWTIWGAAIGYGLFYILLFLTAGCLWFKKKAVN